MAASLEKISDLSIQFQEIQEYMMTAKEEGAEKTYHQLRSKYLTIKAVLQVAGLSLTDIDKIKE